MNCLKLTIHPVVDYLQIFLESKTHINYTDHFGLLQSRANITTLTPLKMLPVLGEKRREHRPPWCSFHRNTYKYVKIFWGSWMNSTIRVVYKNYINWKQHYRHFSMCTYLEEVPANLMVVHNSLVKQVIWGKEANLDLMGILILISCTIS